MTCAGCGAPKRRFRCDYCGVDELTGDDYVVPRCAVCGSDRVECVALTGDSVTIAEHCRCLKCGANLR